MKITTDVLLSIGAKEISPPTKLLKRHIMGNELLTDGVPKGNRLLVAIVHTPFGEHFKEISSWGSFQDVKNTPQTVQYFELTRHQMEQLKAAVESARIKSKREMHPDPPAYYKGAWRGWNEFLGVDPESPDGKKNIEQDRRDAERLSKSH